MRFYNTYEVLEFGRYEGEVVSDVYMYDPSYLEWCILNIPHFKIDIQALYEQGNPTPMKYLKLQKDFPPGSGNMWIKALTVDNNCKLARQYLSEGNKLEEEFFKFSDKAIEKCKR
jgi:hypothetical protein